MDAEIERPLFHYIRDEWCEVRACAWAQTVAHREPWPWGVWICLHDPLPPGAQAARTPVRVVWFLDDDGLRRRSLWEFLHFWTVQIERAGGVPGYAPARAVGARAINDADARSPVFRIGRVAFAEYDGTDEIYLETNWGGLWAQGQRLTVRDGALRVMGDLWRA